MSPAADTPQAPLTASSSKETSPDKELISSPPLPPPFLEGTQPPPLHLSMLPAFPQTLPPKLTAAPEVPPVKPFLETTAARRVQTTYHPRSRFQAPYPRRRRLFFHHCRRLLFICGPPAAAAPKPRPLHRLLHHHFR